ncbi:MAG: FtsW/RodA/SpoVE family cell cycle protein [Muribaculaceae bacterium]|nr:FtsW/RodA/SpoVE family cell cycle protein [Muribaculaceae bacterium]
MTDINNRKSGLDIYETIDGEAVTTAAAPAESAVAAVAAAAAKAKKATKPSRPDHYIWGIYILFLIISVVELFSASSSEVSATNVYSPLIRHGIFLIGGVAIVLGLQKTHYVVLRRLAWVVAIFSLALLVLSSVIGVEINGAQRAIKIAGMTIQPAEMIKLAAVLLLAAILSKNQAPGGVTNSGVIQCAIVVVVFGALLWSNGLTNMILLMGVSISMFLIGGIQWRKFGIVMLVYFCCAGALMMVKYMRPDTSKFDEVTTEQAMTTGTAETQGAKNGGRADTHKGRLSRWLEGTSPEDPIDDMNRQVVFSNFAQAHGGVLGQGPGNSRESARLPLAFSDYIFSIIIEDTGFVGGCCLLLLYLLLVARAGRIAYKCSRAFPAFLIMGCAVLIVFQALVHMAIVTGLFPVSGQPLPFISKGGTSILVMSAAIGMMLSVSRYAVTSGNKQEIKAEMKALPEDLQAANISNYTNNG